MPPIPEQLLTSKAQAFSQCVELRQVKYLNNLFEQDHRFIKRLKPGLLFL